MNDIKFVSFFSLISLTALILETTVINFPLAFFIGVITLVFVKKVHAYILVFVLAFMIDSLRVLNFSYTPLFLLATIGLIFLYEKYSGSNDVIVASIIIAMAGFIYTHFMSYSLVLTLTFYVIILVIFGAVNYMRNRKSF